MRRFYYLHVSIPYSTIKMSDAPMHSVKSGQKFQFLIVRLKFNCRLFVVLDCLMFQFLIVRLKQLANKGVSVSIYKFQFLIVRLKYARQFDIRIYRQFQFLIVRLKYRLVLVRLDTAQFQFLIVRLKYNNMAVSEHNLLSFNSLQYD